MMKWTIEVEEALNDANADRDLTQTALEHEQRHSRSFGSENLVLKMDKTTYINDLN